MLLFFVATSCFAFVAMASWLIIVATLLLSISVASVWLVLIVTFLFEYECHTIVASVGEPFIGHPPAYQDAWIFLE